MRTVEQIVKVSYPDKDHLLSNTTAIVKRQKETPSVDTNGKPVLDEKGNQKIVTKIVEESAPRLKRTYSVPENEAELVVAIGGPENFNKFVDEIFGTYSAGHAKSKMNELEKGSSSDLALKTYLTESANFSMATYLSSESKAERAAQAINQNDAIAALSAAHQRGEIDAVTFATKVGAILTGIAA